MVNGDERPKGVTLGGVLATLHLLAFTVGCVTLWHHHRPGGDAVSQAIIQRNERRAHDHLRRIGEAQTDYRRLSEQLLGRRTYAAFVPHLWRAVDPSGLPVNLGLIPKQVALAAGSSRAVDGYYFIDIRQRAAGAGRGEPPVDLSTQWAVAALPKQPGRTGKLVFLADESGAVFVTPVETFRSRYPLHPGTEGWVAVSTSADLRAYQARLRYTLVSK